MNDRNSSREELVEVEFTGGKFLKLHLGQTLKF